MKSMIAILALGCLSLTANAKSIRATEWSNASKLAALTGEPLIVEFREGDELPVAVQASGDLLETTRSAQSYVMVKKNFWVKFENNEVKMSLDGTNYKQIQDTLSGTFTAGAKADDHGGPATLIQLGLDAKLK